MPRKIPSHPPIDADQLDYHPLTSDRWHDLETLFGTQGASSGCWCMWWRIKRSDFQPGEGNRQAFKRIVDSGEIPGILAYSDGQVVGWCSVAPRETHPTLERSRVLRKVDEQPVWSITCFFIAKTYRRQGIMVELLIAAIEYAKQHGARVLESYPKDLPASAQSDSIFYTGLTSAYLNAGFMEVLRRTTTRPIMRYYYKEKSNG